MAGTDDNNSTSDDWPLAGVELAFVTEIVGSEKLAKELLLDGLEDGSIRWRCRELAVDESPDFSVNPPLVTSLAAARQFFWRRATHSRIDVDWPSPHAIRVGPVIRVGSDGKGNNAPIFDMRGSATLKASLVRFHHGDVVNYLVTLGLMPRPAAVAEDRDTVAGTSIAEQSGTGSGDGILGFSRSEGAGDLVEWPAAAIAAEPVDSAKRFVDQHPCNSGEDMGAYYDRLQLLCEGKYSRKTLRNQYYEHQKATRTGQHGPANGPANGPK